MLFRSTISTFPMVLTDDVCLLVVKVVLSRSMYKESVCASACGPLKSGSARSANNDKILFTLSGFNV